MCRDGAGTAGFAQSHPSPIRRARGSFGYDIESNGTTVHVYHHDGRERIGKDSGDLYMLHVYAFALEAAGYCDVTVQNSTGEYADRVVATPPAATDV